MCAIFKYILIVLVPQGMSYLKLAKMLNIFKINTIYLRWTSHPMQVFFRNILIPEYITIAIEEIVAYRILLILLGGIGTIFFQDPIQGFFYAFFLWNTFII